MSGSKQSETTYKNDMKHGAFKVWNKEGKLLVKAKYKFNNKVGK